MARAATVPAAAAVCALLLLSLTAGAGEAPLSREWELGIGGNDGNDGLGFSEEAAPATADSAAVVRRVLQLQGKDYISYGSMRRGTTPCSVRGASYYNCRPGAQANPYSRGCSAITRCRG